MLQRSAPSEALPPHGLTPAGSTQDRVHAHKLQRERRKRVRNASLQSSPSAPSPLMHTVSGFLMKKLNVKAGGRTGQERRGKATPVSGSDVTSRALSHAQSGT